MLNNVRNASEPDRPAPTKSARSRGRARVISVAKAKAICERIAGGRVLLDLSRDADLPAVRTIYAEMRRNPEFAAAIAAARVESAFSLAEQTILIADEAKDPAMSQLVRNRCDQRRWLAGKFNARFADKTAITDADGGSLVERFRRMSEEERETAVLELAIKAGLVIEHRPAEPEKSEVEDT